MQTKIALRRPVCHVIGDKPEDMAIAKVFMAYRAALNEAKTHSEPVLMAIGGQYPLTADILQDLGFTNTAEAGKASLMMARRVELRGARQACDEFNKAESSHVAEVTGEVGGERVVVRAKPAA